MPIPMIRQNREMAEKMFNRKASPDANLTPKAFLKKKLGGFKDSVIDKVSDVMSYPARRNAQKSIIESDKKFKELRGARMGGKVSEAFRGLGSKLTTQKDVLKGSLKTK